jgi:glyoxylase-like metal-dependent hydrolase (beta-lactamase superfamily II)
LALIALPLAAASPGLPGCAASTHAVQPATLGTPVSSAEMEAILDRPGPVLVDTIVSADWQVTRAGLINLDDPAARAAHLTDGDEPIAIFVHVLRHPTRGTFLVDSGVSHQLATDPARSGVGVLVRSAMHLEKLRARADAASIVARQPGGVAGVLFTHLHLDHICGVPDLPAGTPLYAGPGETRQRAFMQMFSQGTVDRLLAGHRAIEEWPFSGDPSHQFAGVIDVFGDRSLFAIWVPGHSAGSTAYLARTPGGPVLLVGDASHTRWGWEHGVEPGTFSSDRARSVTSLRALRELVARHPGIQVRFGHQP